jgi:hypothetical protein
MWGKTDGRGRLFFTAGGTVARERIVRGAVIDRAIDRVAQREGEALAAARLALLRMSGDPIPSDWPRTLVAALVAAEDLRLEGIEVSEMAELIDDKAAAVWVTLVKRFA